MGALFLVRIDPCLLPRLALMDTGGVVDVLAVACLHVGGSVRFFFEAAVGVECDLLRCRIRGCMGKDYCGLAVNYRWRIAESIAFRQVCDIG